ncbi:helix-turn-helix domain-containing protein [Pseudomonas sp. 3A(2025)]
MFNGAVTCLGHEPCLPIKLTPKEMETLQWAVRGKTAWEISRIQGRSEATINFHLCNIRRKFGVNTLCAALMRAIELRVVRVG